MTHGNDGALQDFSFSILDQAARDCRVTAFDRPGHGYSGRPGVEPLSVALNARVIHAAVQALGIAKPVLVGHSYGAAVALRYAIDYPDECAGLVLLSPVAFASSLAPQPLAYIPGIPVLGPLITHCLLAPLGRAIAPRLFAASFDPSPVPPAYLPVARMFARPAQFRAWADDWRRFPADLREMEPHYAQIQVPALLLSGEQDRFMPPAESAHPLHQLIWARSSRC